MWCAERRNSTLLIGMTKRARWGPHRRDGVTKAGRKLPRGKRDLCELQEGGGGGLGLGRKAPPPPSARPRRAPPRPGALRAAAWAVGEAEPGRYHSEQRGGLGGKGGARGQNPVGGGGAPHPGKKAWAHPEWTNQRARPGWRQGAASANGKGEHFGGSEEEKKKKSPTKQQSNPFGGLKGWEWASFIAGSSACPPL